ncbi:MAG: sigma-54 dependent transcriptional regulator [Neomegalonema sp.]|nr:sigma-54 dependent transcriptional regulator [Neomegalonema sp.]
MIKDPKTGSDDGAPLVLLVDDEEDVRTSIGQALELEGFDTAAFARAERVLERVSGQFAGVIVSDIRMPKFDGMALLDAVRAIDPDIPVILITGHGDVPLAVEAMRRGAYDFLEKPFATARLIESVSRAARLRRMALENRSMRAELADADPLDHKLVGQAATMVELRDKLRAIAASDIDVLILGETGTGKELAARAVHELSDRADKPFVAVNLAALPSGSIESELFGHEAGAFPGAHRARYGKFEHARDGTLFLDEIGAAPLALQAKLLRVIEDRAIERLGSNERLPLNVRFIAASNRDLTAMAASGEFRDDLLYRLAVVTLRIPALRERMEDAPRLFQHLVHQAARRVGRSAPEVTPETLAAISLMEWPGNVREMRNAAERFVLGLPVHDAPPIPMAGTLAEQTERFEKNAIAATLARHAGSLKATYEALGMSRKTLYEKMQRYNLKRQDFGAESDD